MRLISKYKTNKKVKEQIDNSLAKMQRIYANHGTKSKFDVGEKKSKETSKLKERIKELSPIFYAQIYPYKNGED
jgi:hypothetical protein